MLPNLSVLVVIVLMLVLILALDRVLFRPVLATLARREEAIRSARGLAEEAARRAQAATAEFEAKVGAARAELYAEMDEKRRAALAQRASLLLATRKEIEASIRDASAELDATASQIRQRLIEDAPALGDAIADRVIQGRTS